MTAPIADRDPTLRIAARAGGGLIIRRGADDVARVVLLHRTRSDDWSFPNAGRRRGETLLATALRSVWEGTRFLCVAEAVVGVTEYLDRWERPKLVRYWAMNHVTGSFVPTDEVDAIAWVRPAEAMLRLTHDHDRALLCGATAQLEDALERRERVRSSSLG
jgi:8-oxo-dGTP diphosphatase